MTSVLVTSRSCQSATEIGKWSTRAPVLASNTTTELVGSSAALSQQPHIAADIDSSRAASPAPGGGAPFQLNQSMMISAPSASLPNGTPRAYPYPSSNGRSFYGPM